MAVSNSTQLRLPILLDSNYDMSKELKHKNGSQKLKNWLKCNKLKFQHLVAGQKKNIYDIELTSLRFRFDALLSDTVEPL